MVNKTTIILFSEQVPPRFIPSKRFLLALLVFFAFIVQYSQRVNLSIAIICMIDKSQTTDPQLLSNITSRFTLNSSIAQEPAVNGIEKGGLFQEKKFHWTELQQQIILGGYWAGYIFTQIPGGWLATSLGAKWVYATSLGTSSLATLALTLMYLMSSTHFLLILFLRTIIGLAHGALFPATIALWSLWAVPQERSTLASVGFCGTHLGTSLTMFIGGVFCRYFYSGWMYLFFVTSLLGFIWFILWVLLTADSPHCHKSISDHERDFISHYTGSTGKKRSISLSSIPWKNIIKSKPLIALMITHMANLFGLLFFLTNFGKILNQLLSISAQSTGYILSLGSFLTLLSSLLSGIITDYVIQSNIMTLTSARKLSNSLTSFIPVLCMILFSFCDHRNQILGVITVLIFLASAGLGYGSGYIVNFADIVPAYSGVIFGISNTLSSIGGLTGNIVAGIIVKEPKLEQWRILYIIFGIVYFIGELVYLIYGSAVPRKWARFQAVDHRVRADEKLNDEEIMPVNGKS